MNRELQNMQFSDLACQVSNLTLENVTFKGNNYVGALAWDGKNHRFAELQEIPTYVDVQQGDSIITSGYSAMFPEGILVGVVEDVESDDHNPFYAIKVRLAVDFQSVSHVYVVSNPFKNEQSKLERSVY